MAIAKLSELTQNSPLKEENVPTPLLLPILSNNAGETT
jgi:hypothetical protein